MSLFSGATRRTKAGLKAILALALIASILPLFAVSPVRAVSINRLEPATGVAGQTVEMSGLLGVCGAPYRVYWGSISPANLLIEGRTTIYTNFTTQFKIPETFKGRHRVILQDGGDNSEVTHDFVVVPALFVSTSKGETSSAAEVTGTGFSAGEPGIRVMFDGKVLNSGITADARGKWSARVEIPESSGGTHNILAEGAVTQAEEVRPVTFRVTPKIGLDTVTGGVGASIKVTGMGFGPSETDIKVTYDGAVVKSAVTADAEGSFRTSFMVPGTDKDTANVRAFGPQTPVSAVPAIVFKVGTGLAVQPATGGTGDQVTITGSGFFPNESSIEITFDGLSTDVSGITADANGVWTATLTVPDGAAGVHLIGALGRNTLASEVTNQQFVMLSRLTLQPSAAGAGATVVASGAGFGKRQLVTLIFEQTTIPVKVSTDTRGNFEITFKVPAGGGEKRQVTARDAEGNQSTASLSPKTTPPPTPTPLSPTGEIVNGFFSKEKIILAWSEVSDPNGVTYTLQMGSRSDFQEVLVQKKELSRAEYTLSAVETPDKGDYYWRVRAVDGSGNTGAWSGVQPFTVSGQNPLLLFILGGVIVLLGVAALALKRFTRLLG